MPVKRPFWIHQLAEYVLGIVLIAQGLQSPDPVAPAVAGAAVVLNAATVRGAPLSAFRVLSRARHRVLDVAVIALVVALAVQPWIAVTGSDRVVMLAIAGVMGFVWWNSSFAERPSRQSTLVETGDRPTDLGRVAGRALGGGINAVRRMRKP